MSRSGERPGSGCPKEMTYGPCGGVRSDGRCEVDPKPCVFLDLDTIRWPTAVAGGPEAAGGADSRAAPIRSAGAERMRALLDLRPVVVADFPARALDVDSLTSCARALAGSVDAVLAGDSGNARVQFPPSYRAHLIQAAGLAVWSGFNCRDRNRVALEGELAALTQVGVAGVHCVTGDHTLIGDRPDAKPVFDLDSTEVANLARAAGHLVSVGESPAGVPIERRPQRLLEKIRAGAEICFVNHAGGVGPVGDFIRRVLDLAAAQSIATPIRFIPCVPVVLDHESAELLKSFTSLVLPDGYLETILAAADPRAAGIRAATELAHGFLALPGVAGVNLSGGAGPGRELWFAHALADLGDRIGVTPAAG